MAKETKKYELVKSDKIKVGKKTLYRIRALKSFYTNDNDYVSAGDFGGYIQSENNLAQSGLCWIDDGSKVYGNAVVSGDALLADSTAYGNAEIFGTAQLEDSTVCEHGRVCGDTYVDDSTISGSAVIKANARVWDSQVSGNAEIAENARVTDSTISGYAWLSGNCSVEGCKVSGSASISFRMQIRWDLDTTPTSVNTIDGYTMTLDTVNGKISAGCRYLTFSSARDHWKRTRAGNKLGEERLDLVDYLEYVYNRKPGKTRHFGKP